MSYKAFSFDNRMQKAAIISSIEESVRDPQGDARRVCSRAVNAKAHEAECSRTRAIFALSQTIFLPIEPIGLSALILDVIRPSIVPA